MTKLKYIKDILENIRITEILFSSSCMEMQLTHEHKLLYQVEDDKLVS
jgi:hypothetical protein